MVDSIYIDSDNILTVDELKNTVTDAYINDATVTCTLVDADGNNVTGQFWPLTLSYVSGSNGKYRGTFEEELVLTEDAKYIAKITIDAGSDLIINRRLCLYAAYDYG